MNSSRIRLHRLGRLLAIWCAMHTALQCSFAPIPVLSLHYLCVSVPVIGSKNARKNVTEFVCMNDSAKNHVDIDDGEQLM